MKNCILLISILLCLILLHKVYAQQPFPGTCTAQNIDDFVPHPNRGCQWFVRCTSVGFGEEGFCNNDDSFDDGVCDADNPCNVQAPPRWRGQCFANDEGQVIIHPHSCEVYILCEQGVPRVEFCPEGDLLNPVDAFCDPANSVTCENTLVPDIDGVCEVIHVGSFFADESSCDAFWACYEIGEPTLQFCAAGDYFDPVNRFCTDAANVDCALDRDRPEDFDGENCEARHIGFYYPHPEDCAWFFACEALGAPEVFSCPVGNLFNPLTGDCDDEDNVVCLNDRPDFDGYCEAVHVGLEFPHPENCNWFYACDAIGEPDVFACPGGDYFNPETFVCDDPANVDCQVGGDFEGECEEWHVGEYFPHPESCEWYIYCEDVGVAIVESCPPPLLFDPIERICDDPENVVCEIDNSTPGPDDICPPSLPGAPPIFVPSEESCEQYYICFQGVPTLLYCKPGFHWNRQRNFCDLPENANCPLNDPDVILPDCEAGVVRLKPHPTDCTRFVFCYNGNRSLQTCPHLHHFDINLERCLFRNDAICVRDV